MKRFIALLMSILLLLSLAACGNANEKPDEEDEQLYKEIKKAYNAFKDDGGDHSENCQAINKYVFYDGDEYYRVKGEIVDTVKSKNVGNPAAHEEFEGYEVFFYQSSSSDSALKAEIKNTYTKFVADRALSNQTYSAIEDYIYYDGVCYYEFDGTAVCVCSKGSYVYTANDIEIYYNND